MNVLASHQPDFFPYMGYFYKIFQSDVFVFSDDVQYSKKGRHNYNDILTSNGPKRLTLPIKYHVANLNEISISADDTFIEKTLKTLRQEYGKARCFDEAYPVIEELFKLAPNHTLADYNMICLHTLIGKFELDKNRSFFVSSEIKSWETTRDARIIDMCVALGANVYYSGSGAKDYHIEEDYERKGIQLVYSDYQSTPYPQVRPGFIENLSVIDYVMNCGFTLPKEWKR